MVCDHLKILICNRAAQGWYHSSLTPTEQHSSSSQCWMLDLYPGPCRTFDLQGGINLCMVLCLVHHYCAAALVSRQCPPFSSSHQGAFEGTTSSLGLSSLLERLATQQLSHLGGMLFFNNRSNLSFWAVLVFIVVISWALEAWAFKSSISVGFRILARWSNCEDILLYPV